MIESDGLFGAALRCDAPGCTAEIRSDDLVDPEGVVWEKGAPLGWCGRFHRGPELWYFCREHLREDVYRALLVEEADNS